MIDSEETKTLRAHVIRDLNRLGASHDLISHVMLVSDVALRISHLLIENGTRICLEDVLVGALLHDIGHIESRGVRHGICGAKIAKELGYSKKICRIIENHILGGLTSEIITESGLDLPQKNYVPTSIEEKVVAFADQLTQKRSQSGVFLREDPTQSSKVIARILCLYEDVLSLCFGRSLAE